MARPLEQTEGIRVAQNHRGRGGIAICPLNPTHSFSFGLQRQLHTLQTLLFAVEDVPICACI